MQIDSAYSIYCDVLILENCERFDREKCLRGGRIENRSKEFSFPFAFEMDADFV